MFAHGAGLDPLTGLIVAKGKWKTKIETITPLLVDAINKVRKGEYHPERENNELTLARLSRRCHLEARVSEVL